MAGVKPINGVPHSAAVGSFATQRRRASRREEFILQSEFTALLTEYLDPSCAWFTSLENKPTSRLSGMLQKKRHVKSGLADVEILYRRKPSSRCPTHVLFVELKALRGRISKVQKQTRLEILPTGARWLMARSARSAMTGAFLSGVPFRRKFRPPRLPAWEQPIFDPASQRVPLNPIVAAERREEQRRYRLRKKIREREAALAAARNDVGSPGAHDAPCVNNLVQQLLRSRNGGDYQGVPRGNGDDNQAKDGC